MTREGPCDAPVLETARLRLRPHRLEDFEAVAAMWGDPEVTRHIGGKPSTRQQSWMRLLNYAGHWRMLGFGYWVLEEKASARFAGEAGFANFERAIALAMQNVPEAGWVVASAYRGKGYATEAVRAIAAWADANFNSPRTVCLIAPENAASIRVAEKCGYRAFDRSGELNGEPAIFFERIAPRGAAGRGA